MTQEQPQTGTQEQPQTGTQEQPRTGTVEQPPTGQSKPVGDPLAAQLLPVLMHRMNNATQLLSNLHAMSQYGGDTDWIRSHCKDLSDSSADINKIGYLLAVLSSAAGANVLLERRERRGLEIMAHAIFDVIRREGGQMDANLESLPDVSPRVHGGWELPWAFGSLLYYASVGTDSESDIPFTWQLLKEEHSWVLVSSTIPMGRFDDLRSTLLDQLPETQLDVCTEGWSWRFPGDWLITPSSKHTTPNS